MSGLLAENRTGLFGSLTVNAGPGLKFIRIITFSSIKMFFFCCFVLSTGIW